MAGTPEWEHSVLPGSNRKVDSIPEGWRSTIISALDDSKLHTLEKYLPWIDFSSPKILGKLKWCNPKLFDENILEVIFKFEIPVNSNNPFGQFISCNNIVDEILWIDLMLLNLLKNRFNVNWDMLRELVSRKNKNNNVNDYFSFIYWRLVDIINYLDKYCWGCCKFKFKISDALNLLNKNRLEQLFFIDHVFSKKEYEKLKSSEINELMEIADSFWRWKVYNSPSRGKKKVNDESIKKKKRRNLVFYFLTNEFLKIILV